jgi:endonuclease YncB( thermonuclease family)
MAEQLHALHPLLAHPLTWLVLAVCALWLWARRARRVVVVAVLDADTLDVVDRRGRRYRLRLQGVDAPEMSQPHGALARQQVVGQVQRRWVWARFRGRDRWGRHVARVRTSQGDLARWLVREGWAFALPGLANAGLRTSAAWARLRRRGMWADGFVQPPWQATSRRRGLLGWLARRLR